MGYENRTAEATEIFNRMDRINTIKVMTENVSPVCSVFFAPLW